MSLARAQALFIVIDERLCMCLNCTVNQVSKSHATLVRVPTFSSLLHSTIFSFRARPRVPSNIGLSRSLHDLHDPPLPMTAIKRAFPYLRNGKATLSFFEVGDGISSLAGIEPTSE